MPKKPKWLEAINDKPTTRARSGKQETKIARDLKGHKTVNSGATFSQNDIVTDYCEVEAKTTAKESYRLTTGEWAKLHKKCDAKKMPLMVIEFEDYKTLAVISYDDLNYLIQKANE